jgi:membrane protein required for colicin V production
MLIDTIFAALMAMAIYKGYSRGLIVALFSAIAFIVGIAAALKLSTVVAGYLGKNVNVSQQWLPIISFIVVFLIVVFLIRMGARIVEKTVKFAMLGWINRLGGILLYAALYLVIISVALFYVQKINLVSPEVIAASKTYAFIEPWGPKAIEGFGKVIPLFKNMFDELSQFFGNVATKAS